MRLDSITFEQVSDFGDKTFWTFYFPIQLLAGPSEDGWYKISCAGTSQQQLSPNARGYGQGTIFTFNSPVLLDIIKKQHE